jgi:DNA-binding NarL/FixJ family response regulator
VRVAVAEDSGLVRTGLVQLLESAGVEVCFAARDGAELLAFMVRNPVEAVTLDVRMPPTRTEEGLEVAETIKRLYPDVGVLVLSTYGETAYAIRLMSIEAKGVGYLLKDSVDDVDNLVEALRTVASGKPAIDPEIVARLFRREAAQKSLTVLADRELDVLQLMAQGRSNAGIGASLAISPRTVESHVANIFAKLQIPDASDGNRRVLAVLAWLRNDGLDRRR